MFLRTIFGLILGSLLLCLGGHRLPALAGDKVLTVAVNHAPPYRIISREDAQTTFSGIYVDIAKKLAGENDITIEFVEVPFARALAMMEAGTADMMLGPNRTPERERYMAYLPTPIDEEPKIFLVRDNAPVVRDYQDLQGRVIAVLDNSVYFDRFDADDTLQKFEVSSYETGFAMLAAKRLDVIIAPERLGRYLIRDYAGLAVSPYRVDGRPSYIAVSRKSELMAKFGALNASLGGLVESGEVDKVLASYR
jgi:polar amino acid transport system substrate-binding protein